MQTCKLAIFFIILSLLSLTSKAEDGLTADQLDAIDDYASVCQGMIYLSDGKSIEEVTKTMKDKPPHADEVIKSRLEEQKRLDLPKSIAKVGGKTFKGSDPDFRRVLIGKTKLLDAPGGTTVDTLPANLAVLLLGEKDDWYFIRGYWGYACNTGWTLKKNVVNKTRMEMESSGSYGH